MKHVTVKALTHLTDGQPSANTRPSLSVGQPSFCGVFHNVGPSWTLSGVFWPIQYVESKSDVRCWCVQAQPFGQDVSLVYHGLKSVLNKNKTARDYKKYYLKNVSFVYALTYCYFTCVACVTHVCVCLCQVGIILHYSSLSTLLWIGVSARVIYKEALLRTPQQLEGETAVQPTQRPMLRSVKSSWRVGSIRWLMTACFPKVIFYKHTQSHRYLFFSLSLYNLASVPIKPSQNKNSS